VPYDYVPEALGRGYEQELRDEVGCEAFSGPRLVRGSRGAGAFGRLHEGRATRRRPARPAVP